MKEILWLAERVVSAKSAKKTDWFRWRNDENEPIPLSDHYSSDNDSDFVPVAGPSAIPPKTHITRNQFNKKRVRSDVVEPLSKGKQKAVEMTPAPDTQPTDFGMNPPLSEMNPGPDIQPTDFNFNEINKGKQKAVEMTPAPDSQPTDFNFNKINKGKQKAVEMSPAPDIQPTDFGINPSPSDIDKDLNPDDPVDSEILEILSSSEE
ncbi:26315_t:CDS:2, partial [Gigaspora rosea]